MDNGAPLPNLSWLRSFEAAARHLNFTAAAKELNMTQAALSKQVRLLELHFGEALFVRKTRTLELTKLGQIYYPQIHESLADIQSHTKDVFGARKNPRLTVSVIESFALAWLLPKLPEFQAQNPKIELRILSSNWANDDDREAYDFRISYGLPSVPPFASVQLTKEALCPVASPQMAARIGAPDGLVGETLIHVLGYQHGWAQWLEARGAAGDFNALHVDSSQVAYALSEVGLGVAMGRQTLVQPRLDAGQLVALDAEWLAVDDGFYLRHMDAPLSKSAERFRDWIITKIDPDL